MNMSQMFSSYLWWGIGLNMSQTIRLNNLAITLEKHVWIRVKCLAVMVRIFVAISFFPLTVASSDALVCLYNLTGWLKIAIRSDSKGAGRVGELKITLPGAVIGLLTIAAWVMLMGVESIMR